MLKTETQRLRKLRRRMMYYARQIDEGVIQEVRAEHRKDFERFKSGALDQELDEHTRQHGYGQLRTQPDCLRALGFLVESSL